MNLSRFWILVIGMLLTATHQSYGQRMFTYFSAGVMVGTSHYQGDLDDNAFEFWKEGGGSVFRPRLFRPGFGFNVAYHFDPHMYVRAVFNQGWIGAADSLSGDEARKARNLHFRSSITEASLQLVYDFFADDRHYKYRPSWSPYVFTGLSVFHFNPKARPNDSWVDAYPRLFRDDRWVALKPLGTEGQNLPDGLREQNDLPDPYRLTQIAIPIGVGVRKKLTDKLDLRFEIGLRKTFTDYLDDVGGPNYAPPDLLLAYNGETSFLFADRSQAANYGNNRRDRASWISGAYGEPTGSAFETRGNNNSTDWYGFVQIGISYILDRGDRCPKHRR